MRFVDFLRRCICVSMALAISLAQPVTAVAVGRTYLMWEWVPSKEKCVLTGDSTEDSTATNQSSPLGDDYGGDGEGGDVFDPNSKRHAVAQQIFDLCTKKYGLSGAAAVGILVNVKNECGFQPDSAEGSSDRYPWQPEHAMKADGTPPDDGLFAYSDSGGGAGLMQFTPYTTYTESDTFKNRGSKSGWDVELQLEFVFSHNDAMASSSLYTTYAKVHGCPILDRMEFFKSTDAAACVTSFMGAYLRPNASCEAERNERAAEEAAAFSAAFNPNNLPANDELLRSWNSDNDGGDSGAPSIDTGSSTSDKKTTASSNKCKAIQEGEVDGTIYIDLAKQYAEDASIGYSMGGRTKPDMDCSSFVYYCLVDSGAATEEELGSYPFSTNNEGSALTGIGFTEMDYSLSALQKGDVLWRDGHTEIYMGKYDENGNESEDGKQYSCGAHGEHGHPETGDQLNQTRWWEGGQEVGGADYNTDSSYTKIYRPPAKMLQKKKKGTDNGMPSDAMNEAQKRIVLAARSEDAVETGYCLKWVNNVFDSAGLSFPRVADAHLAYDNWCHLSNKGELRVGMIVAVPISGATGSEHGHIGIYVGDGQVMHNAIGVQTTPLDEWIALYGSNARWGFPRDGIA